MISRSKRKTLPGKEEQHALNLGVTKKGNFKNFRFGPDPRRSTLKKLVFRDEAKEFLGIKPPV